MTPNTKVIVTWSSGFKHEYETFLTASSKSHLELHYSQLSHVTNVEYVKIEKSV